MDKFLKSAFIILFFMLVLSFFIHNFASINQDIGRHLKLGEIIWQEKYHMSGMKGFRCKGL